MTYSYLSGIDSPEDLRALPSEALPELCEEIRDFLIRNVSKTGGHLASNLGVVELTVILHRVFDFRRDHLIFDVGHQSYVHKILTGRKNAFSTLRTPGGLSGFTSRKESAFDVFGAGHSSTAISAALGFWEADRILHRDAYSVAVVGDGAYTGGMVHEALNNVQGGKNLIIILNENEMSISKNIGRFATYLAKIRSSRRYVRAKQYTASFVSHVPVVGESLYRLIRKIKQKMKNTLYNSNYFEEMGLYYIGPVDGHDLTFLQSALEEAKNKGENVLVHVKTVKGKGYPPAEEDPSRFHNLPKNVATAAPEERSFHAVFGETLANLAKDRKNLVAITAAMGEGTGLQAFRTAFPERFFDVGIAEPHAVTFASGLAAAGMCPFFAVYSTFLQRSYDNMLHDAALQELPVKLAIDRAGIAASDGLTHNGIFDVAFLSEMKNVEILAPATYGSLRAMLPDMLRSPAPQAIRYPNRQEDPRTVKRFYPHGDYASYGVRPSYRPGTPPNVILITYGGIVSQCMDVQEILHTKNIDMGILLLEQLAPYRDTAKRILSCLPADTPAFFVEEGIYRGGAAMLLRDELQSLGYKRDLPILAIRDPFPYLSSQVDPYESYGIGYRQILSTVLSLCKA